MIEWIVENYQLVLAGVSGIFGGGMVIGSIRGRLKGVETQLKGLDERVDGIYTKIGKIQTSLENISRPPAPGSFWRR